MFTMVLLPKTDVESEDSSQGHSLATSHHRELANYLSSLDLTVPISDDIRNIYLVSAPGS